MLILLTLAELIYEKNTGKYWGDSGGGFIAFNIPLMPFLLFPASIPYIIINLILYVFLMIKRKKHNTNIPKKIIALIWLSFVVSIILFFISTCIHY